MKTIFSFVLQAEIFRELANLEAERRRCHIGRHLPADGLNNDAERDSFAAINQIGLTCVSVGLAPPARPNGQPVECSLQGSTFHCSLPVDQRQTIPAEYVGTPIKRGL